MEPYFFPGGRVLPRKDGAKRNPPRRVALEVAQPHIDWQHDGEKIESSEARAKRSTQDLKSREQNTTAPMTRNVPSSPISQA